MAGFVYYVTGQQQPTRDTLAAIGFPQAALAGTPGCGCTKGPDGTGGHVFELSYPRVPGAKRSRVGYYPDAQTWRECDGWWLGWETDNAPRPIDVQRVETRRGYGCTLADGSSWIVPVVREHTGFPALPTVAGCLPDGTITLKKVETEYERVWALTEGMYAALCGDSDVRVQTNEEAIELVTLVLAMNYHVTKWELLHRELISTSAMTDLYAAIVDLPAMRAAVDAIGGSRG